MPEEDLYDFLTSDDPEPTVIDPPSPPGGNLLGPNDLKPKEMPKSIMAVYHQLGGDAWLLKQAQLYPKEFLGMIKSILPKNIDLSIDQEVHVTIAPAFKGQPIGVVDGRQKIIGTNREAIAPPSYEGTSRHNGHPDQIEEMN